MRKISLYYIYLSEDIFVHGSLPKCGENNFITRFQQTGELFCQTSLKTPRLSPGWVTELRLRCNLHYGAKREVSPTLSPFDTTLSRDGISVAVAPQSRGSRARRGRDGGRIRGTLSALSASCKQLMQQTDRVEQQAEERRPLPEILTNDEAELSALRNYSSFCFDHFRLSKLARIRNEVKEERGGREGERVGRPRPH